MKTMADIRRIVDLYELRDSYKEVARKLDISKNTVKKYVHRVKDVQNGATDEILPKNRKIIQPSSILTETVRQKIHQYLESNLEHPRKQRLTAKRIWELLDAKVVPTPYAEQVLHSLLSIFSIASILNRFPSE